MSERPNHDERNELGYRNVDEEGTYDERGPQADEPESSPQPADDEAEADSRKGD
jgi:hypothetical protein